MRTEGFGGFIRPTDLERRFGRLLRSPEGHDAGSADGGAADDAGDAGASGNADAGDKDAAAGDAADQGDDATILGSATAEAGDGDDKGEEGKDAAVVAEPDDAGVPEAYELKLTKTAEDGTETVIEMDPALVETATPVLKELGLSNEKASKLVELVPQIQERVIAQMNDQFAATRADWAKEAQADPEIGGKNWAETQRLAAKALDHFGAKSEKNDKGEETNEFRKILNDSGIGNHPVMIRMFRDIGAATSEDGSFTRNTTIVETKKSREEANYPEDAPKNS